jgi:hypothetical protein
MRFHVHGKTPVFRDHILFSPYVNFRKPFRPNPTASGRSSEPAGWGEVRTPAFQSSKNTKTCFCRGFVPHPGISIISKYNILFLLGFVPHPNLRYLPLFTNDPLPFFQTVIIHSKMYAGADKKRK